jgi:hypothetical protein
VTRKKRETAIDNESFNWSVYLGQGYFGCVSIFLQQIEFFHLAAAVPLCRHDISDGQRPIGLKVIDGIKIISISS